MNYVAPYTSLTNQHRLTDVSSIIPGDYIINVWTGDNHKLHVSYLQVVSRTKKFITITEKDQFVRLSWNEQDKYWGKNQGYHCRNYINEDELPEGLETLD